MNNRSEFFKVQFFLSGLWHRGKRCILQLITLLLLLGCIQAAFATPTTPDGDFIDNHDGTVTHKTTGLTWMRCALGQTWTGSSCSGTASTYTYDQAVALKRSFAGHGDWRLPNIAELQTIVERENINPAINNKIFPETPNNAFWSSSPDVGYSDYAWSVDFSYGGVYYDDRYGSLPVRLVRASQSLAIGLSSPDTEFTDNHDGSVTHKRTGLVWQRCAVGQTWTGLTCSGTADAYSYDQAIALTSSFAGHSDWRVPNANDLASIVKYDGSYPAINTTIFPNTPSNAFWSSSPYVGNTDYAWNVYFSNGLVDYDRYSSLPVRLVRASQSIGYWPSITVITNGSGSGTVTSNPKGISCGTTCFNGFSSGKKVTLSATPDATSIFVRWEGDCTGTQTSCTVTVNKAKTVTAVFDSTQALDAKPLIDSLSKLKTQMQTKVNSDLEITARAFGDSKNIAHSLVWSDWAGTLLDLVTGTLSVISTAIDAADEVSSIFTHGFVAADTQFKALTWAYAIHNLYQSTTEDGEKLQLAIDGPAYSSAVKAMLQTAHDDACVTVSGVCIKFNQAVYQTVIKNQLNDASTSMVMMLHQSSDVQRKKSAGVIGVTNAQRHISATLQDTINALKAQGTLPATFPMTATLDMLKRIQDQVNLSRSRGAVAAYESMLDDGVQPVKHSENVSLGRIADWERLRIEALGHFSDNVKIQMKSTLNTVQDSVVTATTLYVAQKYQLSGGAEIAMDSHGYLTTMLDIQLDQQKKGSTLKARGIIDSVPEQMLNSLGEELSDLSMIADDVSNKILLDAQ